MTPEEAYQLLEISPTASDEEVRKKFKQLAKTQHPDVNKEPGAEDKFKRLNEAHQKIEESRKAPQQHFGFADIFRGANPFWGQNHRSPRQTSNIFVAQTLTFKESVLGARKTIKYRREEKCDTCSGLGISSKRNSCQHCGGLGAKVVRTGNSVISTPCPHCRGMGEQKECDICHGEGALPKDISLDVDIPPGARNGVTMQLSGAGNFVEHSLFGDSYTNVLIPLTVEDDPSLSMENDAVVHHLPISLIEAVEGCKKTVPTIDGEQDIEVKPLSRHRDEISLPNLGVGRKGPQRVIFDVSYPEDLLKTLQG